MLTTNDPLPGWAHDISAIAYHRREEIELCLLVGRDPVDGKLVALVMTESHDPETLAVLGTILVESAIRLVGEREPVSSG